MGQELMARVAHAVQIDLRFGDPARVFLDFGVWVYPGNFARERVHLFGQGWIGINGQAQPVTKRVSHVAWFHLDKQSKYIKLQINAMAIGFVDADLDCLSRYSRYAGS
jgi:hypothetical protein